MLHRSSSLQTLLLVGFTCLASSNFNGVSGIRTELSQEDCLNFEFTTPVQRNTNGRCRLSRLTPDLELYPLEFYPITFQGEPLPPDCFEGSFPKCSVLLCGSSIRNKVTVQSVNFEPWFLELRVNDILVVPEEQQIGCEEKAFFFNPELENACSCSPAPGIIYNVYEREVYDVEAIVDAFLEDGNEIDDEEFLKPPVIMALGAVTGMSLLFAVFVLVFRRKRSIPSREGMVPPPDKDVEGRLSDGSMASGGKMAPNGISSKGLINSDLISSAATAPTAFAISETSGDVALPVAVVSPSKRKHRKKSKRGKSKIKRKNREFTASSPESEFGQLLKNRLARGSISTKATDSTKFDVKNYKKGITRSEIQSFNKLKSIRDSYQTQFTTQSVNTAFNSVYTRSNITEVLDRGSQVLYVQQKKVIKLIVAKLALVTLDADEAQDDFYSGAAAPAISLEDYVYRLVKGLDRWFADMPSVKAVGVRSLVISLVYLKKIEQKEPNFTLTVFNEHRIFAVTMLIAAKFTEDSAIRNKYWAMVSGMEVEDLNEVEEQFCKTAQFDFFVTPADVKAIYDEYELQTFMNKIQGVGNVGQPFSPMTEVSIDG